MGPVTQLAIKPAFAKLYKRFCIHTITGLWNTGKQEIMKPVLDPDDIT